MFDPTDLELREELASAAYYRERHGDMVADREHELDSEAQYFCLRWEQLSSTAQQPYRIAVDLTLERIAELISVG